MRVAYDTPSMLSSVVKFFILLHAPSARSSRSITGL